MKLWRNTIQLFHRHRRSNFIGPFDAAGYHYRVETLMLSKGGDESKPDIVASGDTGWLIIELTTGPKSKRQQLDKYRLIDPRFLGQYGLDIHASEPNIISSRLSFIDDGQYCQILVKDILEVQKEDGLVDDKLRDALVEARENGIDLTELPEIPFTLLPEMKTMEIRRGLIPIIMELFEPMSEGMTAVQIVDEGLERLSGKIGIPDKSRLIRLVKEQMHELIISFLPKYLIEDELIYRATDRFNRHYRSMKFVAFQLSKWAGIDAGPKIEDYGTSGKS